MDRPTDDGHGLDTATGKPLQIAFISVRNPAGSCAATSVHSGNYTAGGNLSFNTVVNNTHWKAVDSLPVSKWLSTFASDNQYAIHNEAYEKVSPGTCDWILGEPTFETWQSQNTPVFWGVGIPGAGKTILTSFVIHHLKRQVHSESSGTGNIVAFFYCQYKKAPSISQILASLLLQLVDGSNSIQDYVKEVLQAPFIKQGGDPTRSAIVSTLQAVVKLVPGVFFVIDALDELRDSVRDELMKTLISLEGSVFVTSRELDLEGLAGPNIQLRAPDKDFRRFIEQEIDRMPDLRALLSDQKEVRSEVVDSILRKSDGMFLLSALQVSGLEGVATIKSLRKTIQGLPTTLSDMYEWTLSRINSRPQEKRFLAIQAIFWATYAVQTLQVDELLAALAIDSGSPNLDSEAIPKKKTLISACCGLLSLNEETGVKLIHYTTHEFFMNEQTMPFDDPHTFAAGICAVYRVHTGIDSREALSKSSLRELAKQHPFAEYTIMHLGHHVYQSSVSRNGQIPRHVMKLLRNPFLFIPKPLSLSTPLSSLNQDFEKRSASEFAALYGLLQWFKQDLDVVEQNPLNGQPLVGTESTPLLYACAGGYTQIVKFLLRNKVLDPGVRANALLPAIRRGDLRIVQLLVQSDNFSTPGPEALAAVSESGDITIARLLLSHIPKDDSKLVNEHDNLGRSALHIACAKGHVDIVKLLLAYPGIELNTRAWKDGLTPLLAATKAGHVSTAKLLMSLPVNYAARDAEGKTALHYAALNGLDELLETLLASSRASPSVDLDLQERDLKQRTPLHHICFKGHAKCLRILLQPRWSVDINSLDEDRWTALHFASSEGHEECVQMLLECQRGLDINAKALVDQWTSTRRFVTALDLARHHPDIVDLLEHAGAQRAEDLPEPFAIQQQVPVFRPAPAQRRFPLANTESIEELFARLVIPFTFKPPVNPTTTFSGPNPPKAPPVAKTSSCTSFSLLSKASPTSSNSGVEDLSQSCISTAPPTPVSTCSQMSVSSMKDTTSDADTEADILYVPSRRSRKAPPRPAKPRENCYTPRNLYMAWYLEEQKANDPSKIITSAMYKLIWDVLDDRIRVEWEHRAKKAKAEAEAAKWLSNEEEDSSSQKRC